MRFAVVTLLLFAWTPVFHIARAALAALALTGVHTDSTLASLTHFTTALRTWHRIVRSAL